MVDAAVAIITGVVIAAVSSWIAVQLSFRRFRSEQWWERKAAAYERVIEALHHSKTFAHSHLEATSEGKELPEEKDKELRARSEAARFEIEKAMDIGAFLLSDEALSRLKQHQQETEDGRQEQSWFESLEANWVATNNCLKDLIRIAKRDLKTK